MDTQNVCTFLKEDFVDYSCCMIRLIFIVEHLVLACKRRSLDLINCCTPSKNTSALLRKHISKSATKRASRNLAPNFFRHVRKEQHRLLKTLTNGTLCIPLFRAFFQILTLVILLLRPANRNFQLCQSAFEVQFYGKNTFPSALQSTAQFVNFPFMKQQQPSSRRFMIFRRPEFVGIDITVDPATILSRFPKEQFPPRRFSR